MPPATHPAQPVTSFTNQPSVGAALPRAKAEPALASATAVNSLIDMSKVIYQAAEDGSIYARGLNYKAHFTNSGLTFIPLGGAEQVKFALQSAKVGGQALAMQADAQPTLQGDVVSIDRGAFVERYAAHLFVAAGALVASLLSAHQSIGVPQPLKMFGTEQQKEKYLQNDEELSQFLIDRAIVDRRVVVEKTGKVYTGAALRELMVRINEYKSYMERLERRGYNRLIIRSLANAGFNKAGLLESDETFAPVADALRKLAEFNTKYGRRIVWVPWQRPGFELALMLRKAVQGTPGSISGPMASARTPSASTTAS